MIALREFFLSLLDVDVWRLMEILNFGFVLANWVKINASISSIMCIDDRRRVNVFNIFTILNLLLLVIQLCFEVLKQRSTR